MNKLSLTLGAFFLLSGAALAEPTYSVSNTGQAACYDTSEEITCPAEGDYRPFNAVRLVRDAD